jgi:hypothetical protein
MAESNHKIIINNKSYGELDGVSIFLTDDLYRKLEKQPLRNGKSVLELLEQGKESRGFKHIIKVIKEADKNNEIIFSLQQTEKVGKNYFINYGEYKRKSQERFFILYSETGLDAALVYLNSYFPKEFKYEKNRLKESEIRKIDKQLPSILRLTSGKDRNKLILIEEAANTIPQLRYSRASHEALLKIQKQSRLSLYKQKVDELKERLTKSYSENAWQKWIYDNKWLFGTQYLAPIEKERIGFKEIPDFLFPTLDGFLDILEIKKPMFDVIRKDELHYGSYAWCPQTNKAIGQVIHYIQEMEENQSKLLKDINEEYGDDYKIPLHTVKPRAFILIGVSDSWTQREKNAFRTLNYSLHGIEVLTYSDLIHRGESIVSMFNDI